MPGNAVPYGCATREQPVLERDRRQHRKIGAGGKVKRVRLRGCSIE
jgi:hypothetical protein